MHAYLVTEFGGAEGPRWTSLPDPQPGPRQVLVRVRASGVNFTETRMRSGAYPGLTVPFVIGMEAAGEIEELGPGVTGFQRGDRVFGRAAGTHAEKVVFDVDQLLPLPAALDFVQGAAIAVGWQTAWHALMTLADARPGERVLIEAAGGSVASAALQIARWRGCWVAATASIDFKVARALEAGANVAYNYRRGNLAERVLADTGGRGMQIALMTIGEETATALVNSMAPEGRIVMYGSTAGRQVCFNVNIGLRNLQLQTMNIATSARFLPETMRTFREVALPLFEQGAFKPAVDVVLPIADLAVAHRKLVERQHFGKIVLALD
jgi:NADPH:quinone reductase-like Zn-dependent oxidoreductase